MSTKKADVEVGLACGRYYLSVNGFVAAMEGDMCRDATLSGTHWTEELLEQVISTEKRKMLQEQPEEMFSSLTAVDAEAQYVAQKKKDREEHDAFVATHLANTFAVVEASYNEMHMLWREGSIESLETGCTPREDRRYLHWEQISRGFTETIGVIRMGKDGRMPVVLSGFWQRLRRAPTDAGKLVLFWELCSQVTDSRMAERWLKENLHNNVIDTNASNFHNVIHSIQRES